MLARSMADRGVVFSVGIAVVISSADALSAPRCAAAERSPPMSSCRVRRKFRIDVRKLLNRLAVSHIVVARDSRMRRFVSAASSSARSGGRMSVPPLSNAPRIERHASRRPLRSSGSASARRRDEVRVLHQPHDRPVRHERTFRSPRRSRGVDRKPASRRCAAVDGGGHRRERAPIELLLGPRLPGRAAEHCRCGHRVEQYRRRFRACVSGDSRCVESPAARGGYRRGSS